MAATHGLEVREARVLSDRSNLLVELAPAAVVARVATSTADARAGGARDWLARDVAMAGWLAERGAAVVPPADEPPPGPHVEDGMAMTFWRRVEHDLSAPASPDEAGEALKVLHEALEDFPGELPPFAGVLDECAFMMDRLGRSDLRPVLGGIRSSIASAGPLSRPLHGDASRTNLLRTPSGLLWTDFEDCCAGPVEWDLACLALSSGADADAALEPFLEGRRLQGALWTALLAERHPALRARAEERLRRWE